VEDYSITHQGGSLGYLLVHGLGGAPGELSYLAGTLAKSGYAVHCCQLPGHCRSQADLIASRWEDWSAAVATAYGEMRNRCQRVIVGGLSMGAILALNLAADAKVKPDGVVLLAPALWYDGWAVPWYSFLIRLLKDTPIRHFAYSSEREPYGIKDERVRRLVLRHLLSGDNAAAGCLRTPGEALRQFVKLVDHVKPKLGSIKCPSLVLHSREDDMASLSNAVFLQRHLGGLVDCVVLDDCYHMVTIDQQRHLVVDKTRRFTEWLEAYLDENDRKVARRVTPSRNASPAAGIVQCV
jgi:carboxylesterase